MKLFAKTHEWIEVAEDGTATAGISQYAADEMKTLTYVELPEAGRKYSAGESFGTVESMKAASEIYSPATGTIAEANALLEQSPEEVNKDAEGSGWICKYSEIDRASLEGLMSKEEYLKTVVK